MARKFENISISPTHVRRKSSADAHGELSGGKSNVLICEILARAECVRYPWALLWNEVSTINGVFFSLSLLLSPDITFLPEILHGVSTQKKIKIFGEKKFGGPRAPGGVDLLGCFFLEKTKGA